MKAYIILSILTLISFRLPAQKADYGKMSAWVRCLVTEQVALSRKKAVSADKTSASSPMLTAFVRTEGCTDSLFRACGCKVLLSKGDLHIIALPLTNIARLSLHPCIKRIESGRGNKLHMDITPMHLGALPAYMGDSLPHAFTGKGVMVGVMDIGFDLTHPNFYDATATRYRIRSLWDQLSTDTIGSPHYVGNSYHGTEALLAYGHSRDGIDQTHGTHTLGILAGSGYDSPYRGMAYDSDICIVANATTEDIALIDTADYYKYTYATDALGFKYIFDTADSLGMPCVISFSEGSTQDFRGDDLLYYAMLDSLVGPGHIIVSSAGNDGLTPSYVAKPKGKPSAGCFVYTSADRVAFTMNSKGDAAFRMVFYKEGITDTLTISPSNVFLTPDSMLLDTLQINGRNLYVTAVGYDNCYDPARKVLELQFRILGRFDALGEVSVEIVGEDAEAELYRYGGYLITSYRNPSLSDMDCTHTINSPSSSPSVICVGASSYRTSFVNYRGQQQVYDMGTDGVRAGYSSIGPTYDGRIKPDVLAPGTNIVSSYSSFYLENHPTAGDISSDVAHFDFKGRTYAWNSNAGTSMSSPAAAGAIALWLQANPRLTPSDVLGIISRTSTQYDKSLTYPNNLYGYGQINAYAGLLDILGVSAVEGISHNIAKSVTVHPIDGNRVEVHFKSPTVSAVHVKVYSLSGAMLSTQTVQASQQSATVQLPPEAKGVVVFQFDGPNTGSQLVRVK